jgi:hydrogenase expression/formation protein HypC
MCLAIPAKIIKINEKDNTALVDYSGVKKETKLDLVDAKIGDYILIHAGFAIEILDEKQAKLNLEVIEAMINERNSNQN